MVQRKDIVTVAQQKTLDFIREYVAREGNSPAISEIKEHFALKSLRSVTQRLDALQRKGLIVREKFKQRGIRLLEQSNGVAAHLAQIPVIGSAGADNMARIAEQSYGEFLMVDPKMLDPHKEILAVRVEGRSMEDANIYSGDYVIVEVTEHPNIGDLVVAIIGDMSVVKRYRETRDAIILSPETQVRGYSDIVLQKTSLNGDAFKILGRVMSVLPSSEEHDEDWKFIKESNQ